MKRRSLQGRRLHPLRQAEAGIPIAEGRRRGSVTRRFTIGARSMRARDERLRQREEENTKLKRIVADLSLDKAMLQGVFSKKCMVRAVCARIRIILTEQSA
jgi:putative transposase